MAATKSEASSVRVFQRGSQAELDIEQFKRAPLGLKSTFRGSENPSVE